MLYDADKIEQVAASDDKDLVHNHLDIYADPFDPNVIANAEKNGVAMSTIEAAQNSPVYKFVKQWGIALPLHPEFRTLRQIYVENGAEADRVFSMLMGDEVPPRREFIEKNAIYANIDA